MSVHDVLRKEAIDDAICRVTRLIEKMFKSRKVISARFYMEIPITEGGFAEVDWIVRKIDVSNFEIYSGECQDRAYSTVSETQRRGTIEEVLQDLFGMRRRNGYWIGVDEVLMNSDLLNRAIQIDWIPRVIQNPPDSISGMELEHR